MTTKKLLLTALIATVALASTVPAQATEKQDKQEITALELHASAAQVEDSALEAEASDKSQAGEQEDKDKTIAELQARIQELEAKNKPTKANGWSTRKKVAVAAAAVGSFLAIKYGDDIFGYAYFLGLMPEPAIKAYLKLYIWRTGLGHPAESNDDFFARLDNQ